MIYLLLFCQTYSLAHPNFSFETFLLSNNTIFIFCDLTPSEKHSISLSASLSSHGSIVISGRGLYGGVAVNRSILKKEIYVCLLKLFSKPQLWYTKLLCCPSSTCRTCSTLIFHVEQVKKIHLDPKFLESVNFFTS